MTIDDTSVREQLAGKPSRRTRTVDLGGPPPHRILDQASIVSIVLDTKLNIVRINAAAEKLFGRPYGEVLGRPHGDVLEVIRRVNREKLFQRAMETGKSTEAQEVEVLDATTGQQRYFDFVVDPVNGNDGQLSGIVVLGLDTTERTALRRRLAEQNRDLLALQRISNALRKTLDLDRAMLIIASALTTGETGGYARAMIFLVDEQRENLRGAVCVDSLGVSDPRGIWRGLTATDAPLEQTLEKTQPVLARRWGELSAMLKQISVPLTDENSVLAHAIRTGETVTHDTLRDSTLRLGVADEVRKRIQLHRFAAAPMLADREAIGLIVVDAGKKEITFSPEQLTMLEMFASQAALAINNAYKYQNMVERAQRDSLTRLYNHGHFQEVLRAEVERASRYGTPVSLVMLDIDHFKTFNDLYGHQVGDKVLRQTALLLNSLVRVSDVAARYGGEEFAILLPNTPYESAMETAERLRDGVARKATVIGPKGEKLNITASFGVANFPRHAGSAAELVWLADEAMYLAKERGRNRVCGAAILPEADDVTVMMPNQKQSRPSRTQKVRIKRPTIDLVGKARTTKQPRKTGKNK